MGIQDWPEDIILVDLPGEPQMTNELIAVTEKVRDRGDCDVVIDFSGVDIITSSSLSKLLKLRKILSDNGHKLVFCSVAMTTKRIFLVTGLEKISKFADDKFMALESLRKETQQEVSGESQEKPPEASQEFPLQKLWERNAKTK
ncbi:MAG: STAS domain-containing protein [Deltaproteobacteria bacterium]|nr:STAS domain-containing protein [Deltaproteobacteria bacterium]